jgi:hypothetical protein
MGGQTDQRTGHVQRSIHRTWGNPRHPAPQERQAVTVIASKETVEDSLRIAKTLAAKWIEDVDPRLNKLKEIIHHLDDLLNSQPEQLAAEGANSVEDYFDDAKLPQDAAQVKLEVDMIAKWRREARPPQVMQETDDAKVPPASDGQDSGKSSKVDAVSKKVDREEAGGGYEGWTNWETWHVVQLIDNSESTINTKNRLALNALKKGIGLDQLADQFRRMFKKQEDEVRKYHEHKAAETRAGPAVHEWHELEGSKLESTGDAHKDKVRDMVDGLMAPFYDMGGSSDEEPMGQINWREIAQTAAEAEEKYQKELGQPLKEKAPSSEFNDQDKKMLKEMGIWLP